MLASRLATGAATAKKAAALAARAAAATSSGRIHSVSVPSRSYSDTGKRSAGPSITSMDSMKAIEAAFALLPKTKDRPLNVFIQGGATTPTPLVQAFAKYAEATPDQRFQALHIHIEGAIPHVGLPNVRDTSFFVGSNLREAVNAKRIPGVWGSAEYCPVFLSEIPALLRSDAYPIDVALIHVSPPDSHGYVSLGVSVDIALAAVEKAKVVLAVVNSNMPRTFGQGTLRADNIDFLVSAPADFKGPYPFHGKVSTSEGKIEEAIGKLVADAFIGDGATLQMGIGNIPHAVLHHLHDRKGLGIHSEFIGDPVVPLIEAGVVTNEHKPFARGQTVTSFAMGSESFYKFLDGNPAVSFFGCDVTNDTAIIRKMPRMIAINSAIEVDLTGQVVSDTIGTKIMSGPGGQADFIRGSSLANEGRPIIALPSRTSKGEPRISPMLKPGGGVVTTRCHVHYVVTEHGIADVYGVNFREKCKRLIAIAHPDDREMLERSAKERNLL